MGSSKIISDSSLFGVGLRPTHFPHIESVGPATSNFFEIISENVMNSEGRPLEMLMKVREKFPIALHGVALSVGSAHGLNQIYLKKLKKLVDRVEPLIVSDHLCFSGALKGATHDLLPLPLNQETLNLVSRHVHEIQEFLGRKILMENISYYLRFKTSDIDETQFLNELCRMTGCGLLLDLNNIYVNSINHGFDPMKFMKAIDKKHIGQLHLAGHSQDDGFLFDTHSAEVIDPVWQLLHELSKDGFHVPSIVEWDDNIPTFEKLEDEVRKARKVFAGAQATPKAGGAGYESVAVQ